MRNAITAAHHALDHLGGRRALDRRDGRRLGDDRPHALGRPRRSAQRPAQSTAPSRGAAADRQRGHTSCASSTTRADTASGVSIGSVPPNCRIGAATAVGSRAMPTMSAVPLAVA